MGTLAKPIRPSSSTNGAPELLTARELAAIFKLNPQTLYRLARRGVIPAIRIGRKSLRFDPIQVREALEALGISQTRVGPRRLAAGSFAFTRLDDLLAQNRWIAPSPDLVLERLAVDFLPGIDLTTLAYEKTRT